MALELGDVPAELLRQRKDERPGNPMAPAVVSMVTKVIATITHP